MQQLPQQDAFQLFCIGLIAIGAMMLAGSALYFFRFI